MQKQDLIRNRNRITPGHALVHDFLIPRNISQRKLAEHIGVEQTTVNRFINGRHSLSTVMAVKLAAAFGTSPEFWIKLQTDLDLWKIAMDNSIEIPELIGLGELEK